MALYDLSNPLQAEQFKLKANRLYTKKVIVELSEKKPKRTLSQNRYLHLILSYFGAVCGCSLEWVKREYFKKMVNPEIFIREKEDDFSGNVKYLRSSAELTTEEMTLAIERFKNWVSRESGIEIPDAKNVKDLQKIEVEIYKNRTHI